MRTGIRNAASSHDLPRVGVGLLAVLTVVLLGAAVLPVLCRAQSPEPVVTLYGGTGGELVDWCAAVPRVAQADQASANDAAAVSYCFGYLLGIVDTHTAFQAFGRMSEEDRYCIPKSISREQLAAIIVRYGHDHPEELKEPALLFISNAFRGAFPCA